MSTKVAGIDVHKKVLMVVVHGPGVAEQERGKFGTTTSNCASWPHGCASGMWKRR